MVRTYARAFIRQLLDDVPLEAVVGHFIPLKKKGAARYVGICPFHVEKTGSFYVLSESKIYPPRYTCFGCGEKGRTLSFLMRARKMTYEEAAHFLVQFSGMTYAPHKNKRRTRARKKKKKN